MHKIKSTLSVLVLLSLMAATACGETSVSKDTTNADESAETSAVIEETGYPAPTLPAMDGQGRTILVGLYDENLDARIPYSEVGVTDQNGEVFNDALYERNRIIEEKYNVKLEAVHFSATNGLKNLVQNTVMADSGDVDIAMPRIIDCMSLGTGGYIYNFRDVPYVDFDAPWWLGEIIEETTVLNHTYIAPGYANTRIFEATGSMYFSKNMMEMFHLENPYTLVNEGRWTFDTMTEICRGITADLNGDNVYDLEDRYGFATNNANWLQFYASCGRKIIVKDNDGIPQLVFGNESSLDLITRIIKFMNDTDTTLLAEKFTGYPEVTTAGGGANRRTLIPFEAIIEDRAFLAADLVASIRSLRNMDGDFGVLPPPKYDESQENYVSYVHQTIGTGTVIPLTNDDIELMGCLLEDMMYYSYEIVRPALFEIVLNEKFTRDSDSAQSFDKILNGGRLDLGLCMGLTLDNDIRVLIAKNDTSIASVYQTNLSKNESSIQTIVESFKNAD